MSTTQQANAAPARLLANPDYRWWLATDTSTAFASALHSFAVPLLALYITGSPAQAGLVAGIGQLGRILATLPGGVVADRHNRRNLMVAGGAIGLALAAALTSLQFMGLLGFSLLSVLNLLMGMRNGFFSSTSNAALKSVVLPRQVGPAMAANEARDSVVSLAGGPLGGVLMSITRALPFAATAAGHAVGIVAALMIRTDLRPGAAVGLPADADAPGVRGRATPRRRRMLGDFIAEAASGITWLFHRRELRGIVILATIINLGLNSAITSVIFGLQQRGETPAAIGMVSAGIGTGMLVGSFAAAPLVKRVGAGWIVIAGLLLMTASLAVLPFVHAVPSLLVVEAVAILGGPAINAALLGYFMVAVPSDMLGRAGSALDLLTMGATPLSPLVAGVGYALLGWTGILLACTGICAFATFLALFNRPLRSLPSSEHWADHAAALG
jgi:MFS family permease